MIDKNYKIVVFGGGSGLSNLLRGLKKYPLDVTAVVTVGDDGGSSGKLRDLFNMLPPGDIRRVLLSLSSNEDLFNDLFSYRFPSDIDGLGGHTVGNIILAALSGMNDNNMSKAIEQLATILNVKHQVLPVAKTPIIIEATFEDGTSAVGESSIVTMNKKIASVRPYGSFEVNEKVIEAINAADIIVYSQGSLYTSLIPNLFFDEVKEALKKSKAPKVYVANVMTQDGETNGYKLSDHVKALADVISTEQIDVVLANDCMDIDCDILKRYNEENSYLVEADIENVKSMNIIVQRSKFIYIEDAYIRHNQNKLAAYIFKILIDMME